MVKPLFYPFGKNVSVVGNPTKEIVGGKGKALIDMAQLGLPVPPGLVIPTSECTLYRGQSPGSALRQHQLYQLADFAIKHFEEVVVPQFGYMPLLSVRSGARVSMPGMMDTLLNLGLTPETTVEWKGRLGVKCYKDCLVRLGDMYAKTVGQPVPSTLREQLAGAIGAVFQSWDSERAIAYRKQHGYPNDWGTAVTVQAMVFGNLNAESCSGVLFTRDPATGENVVTGEFLPEAQGEDVVAGVRTPRELHHMEQWSSTMLDQLLEISGKLETHYRDAQDIEFTVQSGELFILQTRNAKRTAQAAFKIAHDMALEGMIDKAEAVSRVTAAQYRQLLTARVDHTFGVRPLLTGLPASPGVVRGVAVFDPDKVTDGSVLIRKETSPDDFPAMVKSMAILTSTGGATSHAAVVARGINKPAVVGATSLEITGNKAALVMEDGKAVGNILAGDTVVLDGSTGRVWVNTDVPLLGGALPEEAEVLVQWAVQRANALRVHTVLPGATLPTSGAYYLSVASLTKPSDFRILLKQLSQLPELHGVIGFERIIPQYVVEDVEFLTLLALSTTPVQGPGTQVPMLLKALNSTTLTKKLKKRWLVHMPMTSSDMQLEAVTDAEWSLVRPVRTLADLLAANGSVVFSEEFRGRMGAEKVSLEEVLALLAKTGRSITELGRLVGEKDFVAEVLGK